MPPTRWLRRPSGKSLHLHATTANDRGRASATATESATVRAIRSESANEIVASAIVIVTGAVAGAEAPSAGAADRTRAMDSLSGLPCLAARI